MKTHYSLVMFEATKHLAKTRILDAIDSLMWVDYDDGTPPYETINGEVRLTVDAISVQATPVGNGWNGDCSPISEAIYSVGEREVFQPVPEAWAEISSLINGVFERERQRSPLLWRISVLTLWGHVGYVTHTDMGKEYDSEWWLCGEVTDEMLDELASMVEAAVTPTSPEESMDRAE